MMRELQRATRRLLKNPGFAAVAVVSLALGIGASTAVFSVVHTVLLKSLPVPDPQNLRLVRWTGVDARPRSISGTFQVHGNRAVAESVSPPVFSELRAQAEPMADLFAFAPLEAVAARAGGEAFAANGMIVSDNFFSALGVRAYLGRLLASGEREGEVGRPVVLAWETWERRYAGRPEVLGETLELNGTSHVVVGVLPRGFPGVRPSDPRAFFVLLSADSPLGERAVSVADHWWVRMMARVTPGVTDGMLKAALDPVFERHASAQMKRPEIQLEPGRGGLDQDREAYAMPLLLMLGTVCLVMLVACANLAGLLLARGAARRRELSVRAALGASRWGLMWESLSESLVLTSAGAALGIALAAWGRGALRQLLGVPDAASTGESGLDLAVLAFAVGGALATALASGLLPALRAGRADPRGCLASRGNASLPRLRMGRVLVVLQMALTLVLLAGAGLLLRSVTSLHALQAGFVTERLLTFQVNPAAAAYRDADLAGFYDRVQAALAAIPGARNASLVMFPLLNNQGSAGGFSVPGVASPLLENAQTQRLVVGETFFDTFGIPILRGRGLSVADSEGATKAIVVNESFARRYFPNEEVIGRTIGVWRGEWQIVGVCRDSRYQNIREDPAPTAYFSFRQFPLRFGASFAVRTALPPLALTEAARKAVASVNAAVPVSRVATQEQLVAGTLSRERSTAVLCTWLGGFALLLACIGLHGLMAFTVTRRTAEMAIRMAVGARPSEVAGKVVREALGLGMAGILLGLPVVLLLSRALRSQLYGVPPHDPFTMAGVSAILMAVVVVSAWLPARRAARIRPVEALRAE